MISDQTEVQVVFSNPSFPAASPMTVGFESCMIATMYFFLATRQGFHVLASALAANPLWLYDLLASFSSKSFLRRSPQTSCSHLVRAGAGYCLCTAMYALPLEGTVKRLRDQPPIPIQFQCEGPILKDL